MSNIYGKLPFRVAVGALALTALVFGILSLGRRDRSRPDSFAKPSESDSCRALFAPSEDLEEDDLRAIASASSSLDVAMFAFTDRRIARAIEQAATRGVHVRIYRDPRQYGDERERAIRNNTQPLMDELASYKGIELRVKRGSESMHLKAYCVDGRLLRTGSANWSENGEMLQDNDVYLITIKTAVDDFERDFGVIWGRSDNTIR